MWNIFRMENEVVNNAGKFRALNLTLVPIIHSPKQNSEENEKFEG
jgi:hypothetical protein